MDINKILLIGVGQCGNNIINEFESIGYNTLAINTSELDLETVSVEHQFIIPGAQGCAKNRGKAKRYLSKSYNKIISTIESKFNSQEIVFVAFSLGGGTGSGMSPLLIDTLSRKFYNKKFGAIAVVPSEDESIQCKLNTLEAYNELMHVPNLRTVFMIDNNSIKSKVQINKRFAGLFNAVVNMDKPNVNGVVDVSEIETLLSTKGIAQILEFKSTSLNEVGSSDNIFLETERGCKFIGASTVEDIDISILYNEFGVPEDTFRGYNTSSNIVIITGMKYPTEYFKKADGEISDYKNNNDNSLKVETFDTGKYKDLKVDIDIVKDLDFEKLFSDYNK